MRTYDNWTKKQIDYAIKESKAGKTRNAIAREMQRIFGVKRTGANVSQKLYNLAKKEEEKKKLIEEKKIKEEENMYDDDYEPATRKQCNYYASLVLNEHSNSKVVKAFTEELYKDKALKGLFSKEECSKQIQIAVNAVPPKNIASRMQNRWTDEQEKILFDNYNTRADVPKIAIMLNRTERAVIQRYTHMRKYGSWEELKKNQLMDILAKKSKSELPEKIETFVEKHGNPTTRHLSNDEKEMFEEVKEVLEEAVIERKHVRSRKAWKNEEEFDLLCNFYELSIDEAREHFGRSYSSLAQRLELIVDSEEPEYVLMLKRAAKVISKRKKEEAKNAKMGYFKRRKIARKARKAQKVARKAERLEAKLNKLRGERNGKNE